MFNSMLCTHVHMFSNRFWKTLTSYEFGLIALEKWDHMPLEFGPIALENSSFIKFIKHKLLS